MQIIPIDIVIVPPSTLIDFSIQLNQEYVKKEFGYPALGDLAIPHISVSMMFVNFDQISLIKEKLAGLCKQYHDLDLTVDLLTSKLPGSDLGSLIELRVVKTDSLNQFYHLVHQSFKDFSVKVETNSSVSFANNFPNKIHQNYTFKWINGFFNKYPDNYTPHITIGLGELAADQNLKIKFKPQAFKVFHLGNLCTCIKEL